MKKSNRLNQELIQYILQMFGVMLILIFIWPLGMYILWKNKNFDRQFQIVESIACLFLWLLLICVSIDMLYTEPKNNQPETIATVHNIEKEKESTLSAIAADKPASQEKILLKIQAEYNGSTREGTIIDNDNLGISVIGTYNDKTTEELSDNEYEIKKPVKLKSGKTSTVTIECDGKKCKLKVKCTTKKHRKGENIIGISNKDIFDVDSTFETNDVLNDVTGNWRISTIAENIQMVDYALSYYEEIFIDDKEIHAIVNFNYNTTTNISVVGNMLDVTVHEYVDGEEHDANLLFSGIILHEYQIYLDNGDIKEIQ